MNCKLVRSCGSCSDSIEIDYTAGLVGQLGANTFENGRSPMVNAYPYQNTIAHRASTTIAVKTGFRRPSPYTWFPLTYGILVGGRHIPRGW